MGLGNIVYRQETFLNLMKQSCKAVNRSSELIISSKIVKSLQCLIVLGLDELKSDCRPYEVFTWPCTVCYYVNGTIVAIQIGNDCAGGDTPTAKFFINCLADEPETVATTLVPQIRKVCLDAQASGAVKPAYIRYLTKPKAYSQIFGRLLFGQRKSRFFAED